MSKDTGGPAFPAEVAVKNPGAGPKTYVEPGMSLRDYFAAKALQGYLASCATDFEPAEFAGSIAKDAYAMADAMLAARESV